MRGATEVPLSAAARRAEIAPRSGTPVHELLARTRRLHLVPLPAYAPELNPDEGVWQHLRRLLANGRPDTPAELMDVLTTEICRLAAAPDLLEGCIRQSDLPPFLP